MRKYKQFFIGVIVGAMLFSVVPISAAIEEYILYKADYRVMINGKEYISEDLPILNYKGNTYAPFRSMLEQAGLIVNWNAELGQAEVTTPQTQTQTTNESEVMTLPEPTITQTPDGITQIDTWEGKQYIDALYIRNKIREKGYDFVKIKSVAEMPIPYGTHNAYWQVTKNGEIILDNVPTIFIYGGSGVEVNYYINTILPLIK